MSEYQRYEFMTSDRPLTRAELDEVMKLSSHIEASSTHALIEYHWGDFKHDPIEVLHRFFDGFLYWANWGAPQLSLRFPHDVLPADLLDGYGLDEFVTFTRRPDFDILDMAFGEMEAPDEWTEYELGSLLPIREELMEGDLRALYIVWLAAQRFTGSGDDEGEEEHYDIGAPPVPVALDSLTAAQQALADLFQMPPEILAAAARHSLHAKPSHDDDVAAYVEQLPAERRTEYLVRLAHNEPGLSRRLVSELRALRPEKTGAAQPTGQHVPFATMHAESRAIRANWVRERQEREQRARERHLSQIHDQPDEHWQRVTQAVERGSGAGYDEATRLLVELREVADRYGETLPFQRRFAGWVRPHLRRPAFVKRLQAQRFPLPEA